jgi:polyhydroxyalkanoate synthesis regulator phasin
VKLSKTTLVVPLAGVLLVGAAGAVAAATAGAPAGNPITVAAASASPSASPATRPIGDREDDLLSQVLDDLVTKGTLTETQKTAITDALTAARQERRDTLKANADQLRTFLEDGVITREEFDQLPADSRLRQIAGIMDDGQITSDELRGLLRGGFEGRGGHGLRGPRGGGDGVAPSASPSTSPTTSG